MKELLYKKKIIRDFLSLFTENHWNQLITSLLEYAIINFKKHHSVASLSPEDIVNIVETLKKEENLSEKKKINLSRSRSKDEKLFKKTNTLVNKKMVNLKTSKSKDRVNTSISSAKSGNLSSKDLSLRKEYNRNRPKLSVEIIGSSNKGEERKKRDISSKKIEPQVHRKATTPNKNSLSGALRPGFMGKNKNEKKSSSRSKSKDSKKDSRRKLSKNEFTFSKNNNKETASTSSNIKHKMTTPQAKKESNENYINQTKPLITKVQPNTNVESRIKSAIMESKRTYNQNNLNNPNNLNKQNNFLKEDEGDSDTNFKPTTTYVEKEGSYIKSLTQKYRPRIDSDEKSQSPRDKMTSEDKMLALENKINGLTKKVTNLGNNTYGNEENHFNEHNNIQQEEKLPDNVLRNIPSGINKILAAYHNKMNMKNKDTDEDYLSEDHIELNKYNHLYNHDSQQEDEE
jgi:hypothetical protein